MRIVVDTNVILDFLLNREPFVEDTNNLIIGIFNREYDAFLTANSITDLHYILLRHLHSEEQARAALEQILRLFPVLDTTAEDCHRAMVSPMKDFEDAVMAESARREKMDYIVTRDDGDFADSPVPALFPGVFMERFDRGAL